MAQSQHQEQLAQVLENHDASSSWTSRTRDSMDSVGTGSTNDNDTDGNTDDDEESALDTPTKGRKLFWSYVALAPILALVVVAFAILLQVLVTDNEPGHGDRTIHFGTHEQSRLNGTRDDFGRVYWLGLGWASIETLYYLIQSLVVSRWLTREEAKDPERRQEVRQMLGIDLERTSPWWSVMGRVSSLMVHLGLCCWLGAQGWRLWVPAMIVHGSLYLVWGVVMPHRRWSVPATSYGTLMVAMSVFLVGLALYGEIV
ncbi:hypothetical protein DFQ27_002866 [Actinomortierella ambigua]|uniref:Uncharacterized protein n=1 Tax=Actinomortierella ambigua TaxID=1343610 RepID=A0A9P6Q897_9FUNG|nr:hypothetical protein DFQ27_002866 [Actinomortierella ambigua]